MKKLLASIAEPGVPYPIGAVAHATAGAIIGCIPAQVVDMATTPVHGAVVGALVGVVIGFGAWLTAKALN